MSMLAQNYEYSVVSPGTPAYDEYFALRHEVFCEELKRVPPCAAADGSLPLETDDFDVHSLHVLCRSLETGAAVGCARLILPGPRGLNVVSRYKLHQHPGADSTQVGEIGRMAVSSKLRRYRPIVGQALTRDALEEARGTIKRDGPTVALGLYRELFRLANAYGITHCYAAMEPSLARLLNRLGFPFHEAGPLNQAVSPARQPYLIGAQALRAGLASRNSCLYRFMFGVDEAERAPHSEGAWPGVGHSAGSTLSAEGHALVS